jgi:tol-pal system protein YbgF
MKLREILTAALLPLLGGCLATKQDLQDLQMRMDNDRMEQNRQIQALITRTESMLDSLSTQNARMRADVANRLLQIDRQLVQIQSLSGQSQQQIRDLQRQIEQRAAEARQADSTAETRDVTAPAPAADRVATNDGAATDRTSDRTGGDPTTRPATATDRTTTPATTDRPASGRPSAPPSTSRTRPSRDDAPPTADDAFESAMAAYQRGSLSTARYGFQEFLRIAPSDRRAGDAQFYIGETYARDPDAAIAAYQRVVDRYPTSARAPAALLRMAKLEIARGDRTQARAHLNQILRSYSRSDEADEARTQLDRLGTR